MRLLPLGLSDMVPANHMARVVDEVVVSLDLTALRSLYPGGGAPAHDPRMMLKAVVYAYASGVCSSRKISEATRSNVYFLWLTGRTALDRMTVNRFRTERLRGAFEDIFTDAALMLAELGQENRRIYVNPRRDEPRKKAAERLMSDEGAILRKRRSTDVETVFGDVKRNWGFRRFALRGIEKVAHEWRLLMMGRNVRKPTRKLVEAAANPTPATA